MGTVFRMVVIKLFLDYYEIIYEVKTLFFQNKKLKV